MNFEKLFGKQVIIKLFFYSLLLYANQNVFLLFLFIIIITLFSLNLMEIIRPPPPPPCKCITLDADQSSRGNFVWLYYGLKHLH